jgi:hypothetical protein
MANSRRTTTLVPQQALFLMNSPMAVDMAREVTSRPSSWVLPTTPSLRLNVSEEDVLKATAPRPLNLTPGDR